MVACILFTALFSAVSAYAQTVTWGVNGAGGPGSWDTSTADWYNGASNVTWPTGGNAIFAGASGGTVDSFVFGPTVSSMTFNTPGYSIQDGWLQSGTNGLTITTNADATIGSTLAAGFGGENLLVKNGSANLNINGIDFQVRSNLIRGRSPYPAIRRCSTPMSSWPTPLGRPSRWDRISIPSRCTP